MKNTINDKAFVSLDGHVLIKDLTSDTILLDKHNAINYENVVVLLSNLLSGADSSDFITNIAYGNGGTIVDDTGNILYRTPNTGSASGTLYSETFSKDISPFGDSENTIQVLHENGETYSDIRIISTLEYAEAGLESQSVIDNSSSNDDSPYIFDELGLRTAAGLFISHIIFHPIEKSANRKLQIIYTIRIRVGQ
jgi:hypothetical protein